MKRSELKRKTPLKRSAIKPLPGILRTANLPAKVVSGKRLKSKQRAVTQADRELWERMASLGCVACRLDGNENPFVSIHHIDGRTKPGCHRKVLALCAPHHQQDDTDPLERIAVHPNKARFENHYGRQEDLLDEVMGMLGASEC